MGKRLTIGELSRRTGVSVKTIRFYSDEGLVPPAARTRSGYRLYEEEHVLRIDLVRRLREAGIGLEAIGKVLRRDMTLEEVLRLHLAAVEAHVASLQTVAAALRAAIRSGASETALRRVSMVTKLSNEERRKVVEGFFEEVMKGHDTAKEWIRDMVEASVPDLPAEPTPAQVDAWIELASLLEDRSFVESMRAQASSFWTKDVDRAALQRLDAESVRAASAARERGIGPTSDAAQAIVRGFIAKVAAVTGEVPEALVARMRAQYDPRAERYWELVAIMKGAPKPEGQFAAWQWLGAAMRHHLAA